MFLQKGYCSCRIAGKGRVQDCFVLAGNIASNIDSERVGPSAVQLAFIAKRTSSLAQAATGAPLEQGSVEGFVRFEPILFLGIRGSGARSRRTRQMVVCCDNGGFPIDTAMLDGKPECQRFQLCAGGSQVKEFFGGNACHRKTDPRHGVDQTFEFEA